MDKLTIISFNVRGLGSSGKSVKIIHELSLLNCDIALLQEMHVSCKNQAEKFENFGRASVFGSLGQANLPELISFSL